MRNWRSSLLVATAIMGASTAASAAETQVERGNYLVTLAGCRTCHTPGVLLGKPDLTRILAGSDTSDSGFPASAFSSVATSPRTRKRD